MWTEHTEYEEYHKLQLCTVFRYQHNNTLGKISSNYRHRKNPQKYQDIIFVQYRTPGSSVSFNLVSVLHVESLSLLNLWLLALDETAAGLLIQQLRSMWIGPAACLLGRDLQALFMLEFGTAPDSDPSPRLVSSEQSCQAHFRFPCSSHWSRAVFSEVRRISFVVQK